MTVGPKLSTPPSPGSGRNRYRVFLELARAALTWEQAWPRAWPVLGVTSLFLSVALMDWLPLLPYWGHWLVLIGFAAAFGILTRGAVSGFRAVEEQNAQRRLERDSDLEHRPLTALNDRLAVGMDTPGAENLWRVHLSRMASAASMLRLKWPSPGMASLDPYGVRVFAVLFLVIGFAAAGGDAVGRFERALVPKVQSGVNGPLDLNIWITPQAYTGMAPIFLDSGTGGVAPTTPPIQVPTGSTLLAQVAGASGAPVLVLGGRTIQFAAIDGSENSSAAGASFRLQTVLGDADSTAESLEVRLNKQTLARWSLTVAADGPPQVEFTRAPARTGRAQLRLEYEARDDFGVAGVQVVIRHPDGLSVPGKRSKGDDGTAIRIELALPGLGSKKVTGSSTKDFSAHPWAGLVVLVRLEVLDARGQAGQSDAVRIVLPERVFNHPVARAIVGARKMLNTPTAEVLNTVGETLDNLIIRPEHFFDDTVVFLALSVANSRLIYDGTDEGIGDVQALLWETALRIEDGEFAVADRDLQKIQERLQRALKNGADKAEIDRLMSELQAALDQYMQALAKHLQQQGIEQMRPADNATTMDSTDLQRMIEEARELANIGSREAAQQMLSNLKRMLDSIKNGLQQGKPDERVAKARRLMDDLRKLTQRQQQELDKTYKRHRERLSKGVRPGRPEQGKGDKGAKGEEPGEGEQRQLRGNLGKLMLGMDEIMGGIPKSFGQAERAMKDAINALRSGNTRKAVQAQTRALEHLRQGAGRMAERMARRMGGAFGMRPGQQGQRPGPGSDPFGRRPGGATGSRVNDDGVRVPNQSERRRARQLLDELRRRAGEFERPAMERDYIERLLKRF
ncbi:MAG: TIGR02302 family protein [Alphaproteobacteria bacterium]|nr:TIGR02302 family protein [Alphaproteobacteria bacterium]